MTRSYLIAVAVLCAGCEQLKTPQKLKDLEGKLDELTSQVATMKGSGAGSGSAKPDAHAGSADAKHDDKAAAAGSGAGSGESVAAGSAAAKPAEDGAGSAAIAEAARSGDGKAEAKPADKPADAKAADKADAKAADKADAKSADNADAKPAAKADAKADEAKPAVAAIGPRDASGNAATADAPPAPGASDGGITSDPAFDRLLDVVAKNTAKARSNELAARGGPHWGYEGKTGPAVWGSLDPGWRACGAGTMQSPIDIEPRPGTAQPIVFHYRPTAATLIDNGHTLQVNLARGSSIEIGEAVYQLAQLQFHTPSEHTIAGEHYPLEVQLVHKDAAGKLAMVSVLYDTGVESKSLAGLWAAWPHKVGAAAPLRGTFDPNTLLPETRTVFRYNGSLTTPPCTEGVLWNVMRRTLSDTKAHLAAFGVRYPHNARDVQLSGDRKVE